MLEKRAVSCQAARHSSGSTLSFRSLFFFFKNPFLTVKYLRNIFLLLASSSVLEHHRQYYRGNIHKNSYIFRLIKEYGEVARVGFPG